ncbi:MAG: Bifunctional oligoribonuclease and PAP phosphatase NrnA [Chloroflexi bacterium]|nr:Bifunctional oligoribonuclease and PAP phosphatase NrnA [Chloroflexota bacterium]
MINNASIDELKAKIDAAHRILVTSHIRPDGDAVGSLLGFGLVLEDIGKEVNLVLEDGVPTIFNHLPGSERIYKKPVGVYDLTIVLDCSDISRVGNVLDEYGKADINIDHHPTNTYFGRLNFVNSQAVATAEMLVDFVAAFDVQLTKEIAASLLTGLVMDSLGFRTSNMTPKTLRVAAMLYETGIDLPKLYEKVLLQHSYEAIRYWGRGLTNIEREGRLIWTTLSLEDRHAVEYPGRDDADLVNVLSTVEDTDICVILIEQCDGTVKVSWRAKPGFDVSEVAMKFDGGGHKPAAGATIPGRLDTITKEVLEETRKLL